MRILIVEDDLMIADMLEDVLIAQGYSVCGIARSLGAAKVIAKTNTIDLAIIDLRLAHGEKGTNVAHFLKTLGPIGILFASGNVTQFHLSTDDGDGYITKPFMAPDLILSLKIIIDIQASGVSHRLFPRGFQLLAKPATPMESPLNA